MTRMTILAASAAFLATACGGAAAPNEQMTAARAAIRAAEVGGAQASPEATLRLKKANEQVALAKSLIKEGKNEEAEWVLRKAEVDAELALTLAREQTAHAEATRAIDEVKKLRTELGGSDKPQS